MHHMNISFRGPCLYLPSRITDLYSPSLDTNYPTHLLHVPHVGPGQDVGVDVGGGPARVGVGVAGEGPPPRVEHKLVGDGAGDAPEDRAHPEHPVLLESEEKRICLKLLSNRISTENTADIVDMHKNNGMN